MTIKQNTSFTGDNEKETKEQTKNVNSTSENFDPPDGGWGWIIVMAAGFSNFCILPMLQSFGLIFRDRFAELGINSTQTTTILNINCAVTSCIGLANGPLFRKFSYRQIAFVGSMICAISITILSMTKSFTGAIIFFSILYGVGVGITMSSNALALNTYFKRKRRIATGLSWTCTGMGPIVMPQIITLLIPVYGMEGTVLIFGGFAFNAVVCALLLQPVSWHIKKGRDTEKLTNTINSEEFVIADKIATEVIQKNYENNFQNRSSEDIENIQSNYGTLSLAKGKFGSQYLYYDDEEDGASGIDVLGPGTPMMSRANDGWFSKRNTSTTSIASRSSKKDCSSRTPSRRTSVNLSRQSSISRGPSVRNLNRQNSETEKSRKRLSSYQPSTVPLIIVNESCEHAEDFELCKDPNCNHKSQHKSVIPEEVETYQLLEEECVKETTKKTFLEALIIFFDLDLLRDLVYVNMMLGITFANFSELNFSLLTPFILSEYGFTKIQVATVMSILAGFDVVTRLTIPFIADFIGWQNRTFFLVGICGMAVGRIVLAHVQDFSVTLAIAILIGAGKALRTIFMALVIPTHVPLSRLPGATGIQLLTSGIVALALGPLVGWIRDTTSDYAVMLHCLNIFTYLTVISWTIEICFMKWKSKKIAQEKEVSNNICA
ncbi:PREDICTED: uncharacterized protein LOC108554513 isoform X1 [Eufriesea mexicana]|uniref:uncharacterized protein LOC108554513 isoform X1 n=2 Tax=Eufriesea mexicana TaxID=516756 RepID=UPI00083C2D73|nr:PREDICTED: uncharacterized protein LOC108554513 isoform X1 [Eufriesea mexicana]XP_017765311.1 PREDICTED: uncharacterized protein LOC108554513 isoform X1 [Eufriesea mexicana]